MKRIITIVCCVCIVFTSIGIGVKANNLELYAYTRSIDAYDDYIQKRAGEFILVQQFDFNYLDIVVGKGIYVFSVLDESNVMIYPVLYNRTVLGEIVVGKDGDEVFGTFCRSYNEVLNDAYALTSKEEPLRLVLNEYGLTYMIGNTEYRVYPYGHNNSIENHKAAIAESNEFIECISKGIDYEHKIIDRYPNARTNTWSAYSNMGSYLNTYKPYGSVWCYAHCLYNIFLNLGINTYSSVSAVANMAASSAASAYISTIGPNLVNAGFSCTYSNSGSLSFSSIVNTIYNNNNYVFMGNQLKYSGAGYTWEDGHATVLYGYAYLYGTYYYDVWDPAYPNGGSGLITMTGPNYTYFSADGLTQLKWNLGYIRNIN